jgi:hypothetical protein
MKNAVFWDVASCGFIINRRFGVESTSQVSRARNCIKSISYLLTLLTDITSPILKTEAIRSSETSVYNKPTQRQIPENEILQI